MTKLRFRSSLAPIIIEDSSIMSSHVEMEASSPLTPSDEASESPLPPHDDMLSGSSSEPTSDLALSTLAVEAESDASSAASSGADDIFSEHPASSTLAAKVDDERRASRRRAKKPLPIST